MAFDVDLNDDDMPRYGVNITGALVVISQLIDELRGGCAVTLVGIGHGALEINPVRLIEKEMWLAECFNLHGRDGLKTGKAADRE